MRRPICAGLLLLLTAACSQASHSGATESPTPTATPTAITSPTPAPLQTGHLVGGTGTTPGAIAGLRYRTATQSGGVTDAAGTFSYRAGESVTFSIADVDFRAAPGAPMLSPWQLAGSGACAPGDELSRALVLLYSLDVDGDPANGTAVPTVAQTATQRAFSTLNDADVATLIDSLIPGRTPVAAAPALVTFITQVDGEEWTEIAHDDFMGTTGLVRSQGVATDGTNWFFSWEYGLERTDAGFTTQKSQSYAIPAAQAALGDNHIGDIDYDNGTLYVPLEDGSAYVHPFVATFDPTGLTSTAVFPISTTLMTKGVPWVAVDGPRGNLYIAEWDPTLEIHVYDLATMTYTGEIPLSTTVTRIQGAKVFEGSLYLSTDDSAKNIFKVELDTGTVLPLFAIGGSNEEEGLAIRAMPDGSALHTLNVNGLGMTFRHHQRTRAPLRASLCSL